MAKYHGMHVQLLCLGQASQAFGDALRMVLKLMESGRLICWEHRDAMMALVGGTSHILAMVEH